MGLRHKRRQTDAGDSERGGRGMGRLVRVQAPALRREPQRSEGGVAHEPARLHSCSKFTPPGSYYSNISK